MIYFVCSSPWAHSEDNATVHVLLRVLQFKPFYRIGRKSLHEEDQINVWCEFRYLSLLASVAEQVLEGGYIAIVLGFA